MTRRAGTVGADQESKVLSQTAVRLTQNGILKISFEDCGFQVIEDYALDNPTEELEGMFTTAEPGGNLLVEDELDILMAGPGEGHDEHPGFSWTACQWVPLQTGVAEVDLGFLSRRCLDPAESLRLFGYQPLDETPHGGIAAVKAMVVPQTAPDGDTFDPGLVELDDHPGQGLQGTEHVPWAGRRTGQGSQLLPLGQRPGRVQQPFSPGQG